MARFSVDAVFKATDRLTRPVAKMGNKLARFSRSASRGMRDLDRVSGKFIGTLRKVGVAAGVAGAAFGIVGKNVFDAGSSFEQAITDVGAVGLKTRDQIAELEAEALRLGATTKFTATEAASAMEIMAKAGFDSAEIMSGVGGVLDAAAASGLEMAEVADVVSNVLKGMGLEASKATDVADLLALASSRTNSTIGSLGESMRNVSSTARQLGVPLKDAITGVALLQDVGLDASVAGSAMNTMLTKLAAPTATLERKLKKLGVAFKDEATGNMLPFTEVLANLDKAGDKAGGNMDKVALLAELVGLRGQKAAANLADLFASGKFAKLSKELDGAAGSAKKMAELRMKTARGQFTLLGSAIDSVKVAIFNVASGPLQGLVKKITEWTAANKDLIATRVQELFDSFIEALPQIVLWMTRIGKMVGVVLAFATAIKVVGGAVAVVNAIVAANPIALLVMAIIGAIALIVAFWPEISAFFVKLWKGTLDMIGRFSSAVSAFIQSVWGPVKAFFVAAVEFLAGLLVMAIEPLLPALQPVFDFIAGASDMIVSAWSSVSGFFAELWGAVVEISTSAWGALVSIGKATIGAFKSVWAPISSFFGDLWQGAVDLFKEKFGWILGKIEWAIGKIHSIRSIGSDAISSVFGGDDPSGSPQVVSPSERVSRSFSESVSTTRAQIDIRDSTGRAQVSQAPTGPGMSLNLQPSGAF